MKLLNIIISLKRSRRISMVIMVIMMVNDMTTTLRTINLIYTAEQAS